MIVLWAERLKSQPLDILKNSVICFWSKIWYFVIQQHPASSSVVFFQVSVLSLSETWQAGQSSIPTFVYNLLIDKWKSGASAQYEYSCALLF